MAATSEPIRFDAQCDIAALVYGPGKRPDDLLGEFASDLLAEGFDVVGVLQTRNPSSAGWQTPDLVFLPDGHRLSLASPAGDADALARACLDALAEADAWLRQALRRRPDVLVLNRFGSSERSGAGLIGAVAQALALEVPVLLAVPQALFGDWLEFSQGLTVKLECRRESLDAWWISLGWPSSAPRRRFCETFK